MTEIIFEVREDEAKAGYTASAFWAGIHTEAGTLDDLRLNIREAMDCYYDDEREAPASIKLHFASDKNFE